VVFCGGDVRSGVPIGTAWWFMSRQAVFATLRLSLSCDKIFLLDTDYGTVVNT